MVTWARKAQILLELLLLIQLGASASSGRAESRGNATGHTTGSRARRLLP
jgi:hypothetical protein